MNIMGIGWGHQSSAALLKDGIPVAVAEEERFSRIKHDSNFPEQAVRFVLEQGGIKAEDLNFVVFANKPLRTLSGQMARAVRDATGQSDVPVPGIQSYVYVREVIARIVGIPYEKVLFSEHHLSHAASAYYCSPYNEAAILTVDGSGEHASTTIGIGQGNKLKILKEIYFPHSLGFLYAAYTQFLGFKPLDGEYKVMGMAPYGKPRHVDKVKKMIRFYEDGSYEMDPRYFAADLNANLCYTSSFEALFGKPRNPESLFFTSHTGWPSYFGEKPLQSEYNRLAEEQEYYADIAASLQEVLEEGMIRLAKEARQVTGMDKLCLAGGVGLNSCANWKIARQAGFKEIFVPPAADDGGVALGAALLIHHQVFDHPRRYVMKTADYGKSYLDREVSEFIKGNNIRAEYLEDEEKLITRTVDALTAGKVIGWFNGRFEWGPRALGSRSILADPRRVEMKDIVNTKIKFREPYRPFAPSVLAKEAENFFNLPDAQRHYPARFMLYVVDVLKEKQSLVPAITHVDGTARPQLVFMEDQPRYHHLISEYSKATGIPLILNTSFNLKGEPIVNSPEEAYLTFLRSGLDLLVVENWIVEKSP